MNKTLKTVLWSVGGTLGIIYLLPFALAHWIAALYVTIGTYLILTLGRNEKNFGINAPEDLFLVVFFTFVWPFLFVVVMSTTDEGMDKTRADFIETVKSDLKVIFLTDKYEFQSPIKRKERLDSQS